MGQGRSSGGGVELDRLDNATAISLSGLLDMRNKSQFVQNSQKVKVTKLDLMLYWAL